MQKYTDYVRKFHESNPNGLLFVEKILPKHLKDHPEDQTEIETVLDYLYSNPNVDVSEIGYSTLVEKTQKWHNKLASQASKDTETEGTDYVVEKDFGDGFRFVRLVSKDAYVREGKLMSHCVASYYGRDAKIYSLRDKKNLPHCTVEQDKQVKGK